MPAVTLAAMVLAATVALQAPARAETIYPDVPTWSSPVENTRGVALGDIDPIEQTFTIALGGCGKLKETLPTCR